MDSHPTGACGGHPHPRTDLLRTKATFHGRFPHGGATPADTTLREDLGNLGRALWAVTKEFFSGLPAVYRESRALRAKRQTAQPPPFRRAA